MGAAHRDVGGGNGFLLPLLRRLRLLPLPLPTPEEASPGQEGKIHSHVSSKRAESNSAQHFQVRIEKTVATLRPPVEVESDAAAEPAEQDDLLDRGAAGEPSDWL